jgi:hypothetical protein
MRRSSWTDQRMRLGASGRAGSGFLGRRRVGVVADDRQYDEGQHHQRDVGVPAMPGAGLVVVEAELVLGGLEAVLDRPARPPSKASLICSSVQSSPPHPTLALVRLEQDLRVLELADVGLATREQPLDLLALLASQRDPIPLHRPSPLGPTGLNGLAHLSGHH